MLWVLCGIASNEYPQLMSLWRNKKNIHFFFVEKYVLSRAMLGQDIQQENNRKKTMILPCCMSTLLSINADIKL